MRKVSKSQVLDTKSVEHWSSKHERCRKLKFYTRKLCFIKKHIFLERAISRSGHLTGLPVAKNRRGWWNQYRQTWEELERSLWSRVLADLVENLTKNLAFWTASRPPRARQPEVFICWSVSRDQLIGNMGQFFDFFWVHFRAPSWPFPESARHSVANDGINQYFGLASP